MQVYCHLISYILHISCYLIKLHQFPSNTIKPRHWGLPPVVPLQSHKET